MALFCHICVDLADTEVYVFRVRLFAVHVERHFHRVHLRVSEVVAPPQAWVLHVEHCCVVRTYSDDLLFAGSHSHRVSVGLALHCVGELALDRCV